MWGKGAHMWDNNRGEGVRDASRQLGQGGCTVHAYRSSWLPCFQRNPHTHKAHRPHLLLTKHPGRIRLGCQRLDSEGRARGCVGPGWVPHYRWLPGFGAVTWGSFAPYSCPPYMLLQSHFEPGHPQLLCIPRFHLGSRVAPAGG